MRTTLRSLDGPLILIYYLVPCPQIVHRLLLRHSPESLLASPERAVLVEASIDELLLFFNQVSQLFFHVSSLSEGNVLNLILVLLLYKVLHLRYLRWLLPLGALFIQTAGPNDSFIWLFFIFLRLLF